MNKRKISIVIMTTVVILGILIMMFWNYPTVMKNNREIANFETAVSKYDKSVDDMLTSIQTMKTYPEKDKAYKKSIHKMQNTSVEMQQAYNIVRNNKTLTTQQQEKVDAIALEMQKDMSKSVTEGE